MTLAYQFLDGGYTPSFELDFCNQPQDGLARLESVDMFYRPGTLQRYQALR